MSVMGWYISGIHVISIRTTRLPVCNSNRCMRQGTTYLLHRAQAQRVCRQPEHSITPQDNRPFDYLSHLCLEGADVGQQRLELLGLGLEVAVATNVLLADEDVGHCALAGQLLEGVLDGGAIFLLVELKGVEVGVVVLEELLGLVAVGAVRLGEHR